MKLNVLYQFNEAYVPFAGVSLTSLFENNIKIIELTVHVLVEEVSEESKKKLENLCVKYKRKIIFYETNKLVKKMQQLGVPQYRGSYATNFKMFFPEMIDPKEDRILYIDSDTLVNDTLSEILTIDMGGFPIAMALDSLARSHKRHLGFLSQEPYYNAGVILFDLKKWREDYYTDKIVNHVKHVRAHYCAPDQDLLNIVCKDKIQILDLSYNFQPMHAMTSIKQHKILFAQKDYYDVSVIEKALEKPKVIHFFRFLGEFPWHKNAMHPFKNYFEYYLRKSDWNEYEKKPSEKQQMFFRIERILYRVLPRFLFLILFKINYDFFMWKANFDSLHNKINAGM